MRTLPLLTLCLASSSLALNADAQSPLTSARKNAVTKPIPPMGSSTNLVAATGSDDCANASAQSAISGNGVFAVDNTAATTSLPVGSCGAMGNDVWFVWTATSSGTAVVSTCGGTASDTVIAIWDGAPAGTCPTTEVTCLDDFCGLQTQVSFPVIAGQSFFLEIGGYNGSTYSGTFSVNVSGGSTNDDCGSPTAIAGVGSFAFDNTAATTGAQGQTEALCNAFGTTAIGNDTWYAWTAPSTGAATLSVCGGSGSDTKVAVYDGAGCPVGAAIACNDDFCGLLSEVGFSAVVGQVYALQIGQYPGSAAGSGTFTLSVVSPDACATPTPISGLGSFAFDTTAATTGAEGQTEAGCLFFGTSGIANDIWYTWTAPTSGTATLETCAQTTLDTKVAVYDGTGCPAAASIACNDDFCGLQSQVTFAAVAGQSYTIQLGNYPGGPGSTGTFTIDIPGVPPTGCQYDDGVSENSVGLTAGGEILALHRLVAAGPTSISTISVAFGSPAFPNPALIGLPVRVAVWDDPNDDGVPNDLVLLTTANGVITSADSDTLVAYSLGGSVAVNGDYYIGAAVAHGPNTFPLALDQSTTSMGRAFVAGEIGGALNLANLNAAALPPTDMDGVGLPGVWLLRADCSAPTGTSICDGTAVPCPCGNNGAAGNGCGNSFNAAGANLTGTGNPSLANDTVTLIASGMTNGPVPSYCTFTQSSTVGSGVVFGDGVLCLNGSLLRLGTRAMSGGTASLGAANPGDPQLSVIGLIAGPGTRHYQVVYRNSAPFCTTATFNVTNGFSIVWN